MYVKKKKKTQQENLGGADAVAVVFEDFERKMVAGGQTAAFQNQPKRALAQQRVHNVGRARVRIRNGFPHPHNKVACKTAKKKKRGVEFFKKIK